MDVEISDIIDENDSQENLEENVEIIEEVKKMINNMMDIVRDEFDKVQMSVRDDRMGDYDEQVGNDGELDGQCDQQNFDIDHTDEEEPTGESEASSYMSLKPFDMADIDFVTGGDESTRDGLRVSHLSSPAANVSEADSVFWLLGYRGDHPYKCKHNRIAVPFLCAIFEKTKLIFGRVYAIVDNSDASIKAKEYVYLGSVVIQSRIVQHYFLLRSKYVGKRMHTTLSTFLH